MNVVYEAILKEKHNIDVPGIHSWNALRKIAEPEIYLFGATKAGQYFIDRYGDKYQVQAILDNNDEKQGDLVEGIEVYPPTILEEKEKDSLVVIISSTNYYKDIYMQLKDMGIENTFILCKMEEKRFWVRFQIAVIKQKRRLQNQYWEMLEKVTGFSSVDYVNRNKMKGYHKYPIARNKIVFLSGGKYKEHGKYISEALHELNQELDLVWILNDNEVCPDYIRRICENDSEQIIYELATAKVWINSDNFPRYLIKRKEQIYIQTKHWSSITLKKFYFDTPIHFKTRPTLKYFWKHDVKMYDYIMVGSEFDKKTVQSGFRYNRKFMEVGSPRTDALYHAERYRDKIFDMYQMNKDEKLLLYAPTFRVNKESENYESEICNEFPDFDKISKALNMRWVGKWKVGLRLHPFVAKQGAIFEQNGNVINMSEYDDIQELLAIADIVITDYSSLMFEPAMVGKPVFLFTPDLQEYVEEERELWFDIRELPFAYALNEDELCHNILIYDENKYKNRVENFFETHGVKEDGHASERAAQFILNLMKSEK